MVPPGRLVDVTHRFIDWTNPIDLHGSLPLLGVRGAVVMEGCPAGSLGSIILARLQPLPCTRSAKDAESSGARLGLTATALH